MSADWIKFLRHYGPVSRNDSMYDETIQRSARSQGITPIEFEHPYQRRIAECFDRATTDPVSVILTGTAGDGKTHLCRQVWKALNGSDADWASDDPYLSLRFHFPSGHASSQEPEEPSPRGSLKVHFIRDLSGWAPQQGAEWDAAKEALLHQFCHSLFGRDEREIFLIAANDGQLIECFRRLKDTADVKRARDVFEDLLVEDRQDQPGVRLKFFNLSRTSSAELFDRAIDKFLAHPGWAELKTSAPGANDVFGPNCPIRQNYELLGTRRVNPFLVQLKRKFSGSSGLRPRVQPPEIGRAFDRPNFDGAGVCCNRLSTRRGSSEPLRRSRTSVARGTLVSASR